MDWYEHFESAQRALDAAQPHLAVNGEEDWLAALRWMRKANDHIADVSIHAAQQALNEGKTKKAIAQAVDVSPSVFRGMQKTGTR